MPLIRRHPRRNETNVSMVRKHFRKLTTSSSVPHGDRDDRAEQMRETEKFNMDQTIKDMEFAMQQLEQSIEQRQALQQDTTGLEHRLNQLEAQKEFLENQRRKL